MKHSKQWIKLDNAAKLFPGVCTRKDPKVFRVSCELYEEIDPKILQEALDLTLKSFPLFQFTLKRGLFWYYLQKSILLPEVSEESNPICSPIYNSPKKRLLFQVTYFHKRINLELFHVLADGKGAMQFLQTMVFYYLSKTHADVLSDQPLPSELSAMPSQSSRDSFSKYYSKVKLRPNKEPKAYHIKGDLFPDDRLGIVEGTLSGSKLLAIARSNDATLTELITATLMLSIFEGMAKECESKPVVIAVPVNLRSFFPSTSLRNFFMVVNIKHDFSSQGTSLKEVITNIKKQFKEKLTTENLSDKINLFTSLEKSFLIKMLPLFLKVPILKLSDSIADQGVTATLSNIGIVTMDEKLSPFIRLFDIFNSTNALQLCICTFEDKLTLSITSPYNNTDIQLHFFRTLANYQLDIEVSSNVSSLDL